MFFLALSPIKVLVVQVFLLLMAFILKPKKLLDFFFRLIILDFSLETSNFNLSFRNILTSLKILSAPSRVLHRSLKSSAYLIILTSVKPHLLYLHQLESVILFYLLDCSLMPLHALHSFLV